MSHAVGANDLFKDMGVALIRCESVPPTPVADEVDKAMTSTATALAEQKPAVGLETLAVAARQGADRYKTGPRYPRGLDTRRP